MTGGLPYFFSPALLARSCHRGAVFYEVLSWQSPLGASSAVLPVGRGGGAVGWLASIQTGLAGF
jgi:hypothetical protein